ncbi:hypothetical protein GEMRC1_008639 [Eukaryota sp. GEM-RC1]
MSSSELPELPHLIHTDSLPLSSSLLDFYKNRVTKLEDDLSQAIHLIQLANQSTDLSAQPPPLQNALSDNLCLRRKIFDCTEELHTVKTRYRESLLSVMDERELLIKTIAENDRLKEKEVQDRLRIQKLLDITSLTRTSTRLPPSPTPQPSQPSSFETVSLLELYKERIDLMESERSQLINDYDCHVDELTSQLNTALSQCQELENHNKQLTADYIALKNEASFKLRTLIESYESLKAEYRQSRVDSRVLGSQIEYHLESREKALEDEKDEVLNTLRKELLRKDTDFTRNTIKLETELDLLKEENQKLRNQAAHFKTEAERADQRRVWAFEGFEKDVCDLRKKLEKLEKGKRVEELEADILTLERKLGSRPRKRTRRKRNTR